MGREERFYTETLRLCKGPIENVSGKYEAMSVRRKLNCEEIR